MNGDYELHDLRFEGYSNDQLAQQIDGLRNGAGPQSLRDASEALITLAGELAKTDKVLREQLQAIGVSWEGQAAEGGVQATQEAAIFADEAVTPVGDSAAGVATQSGEFTHTRNSAPDSGTLRGPTELTGFDRFADTVFGHTTDNAQKVRETNAARDAAVAGMNGYQQGSADALGRAQTLPVPPGINLVTQPVDTGTRTSSVGSFGGGTGYAPAGAPGTPGGPSAPGPSGGPGTGPGPFSGPPGTPPGVPPPPGAPGPTTGIGPITPGPGAGNPGFPPGGPRALPSMFLPEAAAIANAGAAGAAVGSTAEKDRLVRGRPGAPGAPGAPGGAPPSPGQEKAKGATSLGTPPDDEAKAARNAERYGAKPGKSGAASIMSPAAGTAPREGDTEHVRKYGIDSEDVFGDERLTAPPLIGEGEIDEQKVD